MSIYDIQNITVEEMGSPVFAYRIRAVEGFVIKLPAYPENVYKTVAILYTDYDFSAVQIIAESDLPEGAEIYGNTGIDNEIA